MRAAIADRIRDALVAGGRRTYGWGVRDLTRAVCEAAGVPVGNPDAAKPWLAGAMPDDPRLLVALPKVLGVRAGWLYFGEEPREDESSADAARRATTKGPRIGRSGSPSLLDSTENQGEGKA